MGRVQSEEAVFRACQRQTETLQMGATGNAAELTKLTERAVAAEEAGSFQRLKLSTLEV